MCKVERIMGPSSEDFLTQHRALEPILDQGIQETMTSTPSEMESSDPTYVFIDMLAQAAVLVLLTALKSLTLDTETYHDTCGEYEKKAFKAAEMIHSLVQRLSHLGCFKVHPFTPIALFICAEFTRSLQTPSSNHAAQFKTISTSLRQLAPANKLAQMLEVKLQRDPQTDGTTRDL
ncbi:hypothetical protein P168DRAFT_283569 [Aspergillus campestris IBT 28561]|uniref:Uncharacterized protein n=1 Tax=Aspergillus campestris (strain IBT 28561) TaxID=1392248 RepID=A0A2I1CYY2_ASPC2|nr:uncharacterized protein P168DRAFT_283569 [Aspergillus campestris IBT 28561]PKY02825.1 hypothetical protein P168DRAFT_283569 [Aspergillus campestris IBT 28561]